jgi:hypothetical protein
VSCHEPARLVGCADRRFDAIEMEEPMRSNIMSRCWPQRMAGCAVVVVLAGCAGALAAPVVASPVAAGAARIWFYRDYEPSVSLNVANVALNGASAGSVQPDDSSTATCRQGITILPL